MEGVRFLGPSTERWKINYIQLAKQSCSEANQPHLSPSPLTRKQKQAFHRKCKELVFTGGRGREKVEPKEHPLFQNAEPQDLSIKLGEIALEAIKKISLITPAKQIPRRHCVFTSTPGICQSILSSQQSSSWPQLKSIFTPLQHSIFTQNFRVKEETMDSQLILASGISYDWDGKCPRGPEAESPGLILPRPSRIKSGRTFISLPIPPTKTREPEGIHGQ